MSTAITGTDGITRFVTFTKTASSGWRFTWGNNEFVAWKDPAGFSHRAWNLYFIAKDGTDKVIDDNLASREEAVQSAIEWSKYH
jgi:hypothetical protein